MNGLAGLSAEEGARGRAVQGIPGRAIRWPGRPGGEVVVAVDAGACVEPDANAGVGPRRGLEAEEASPVEDEQRRDGSGW